MFDDLLAHPHAVRLITWRRLERPQAGPVLTDTFVRQVAATRDLGAAVIRSGRSTWSSW